MTSKRKAPDENPLLNPPKRSKNEKDKTKAKRLPIGNGEQQSTGLVIFRAPSASQETREESRPLPPAARASSVPKHPRPDSRAAASQPLASTSKAPPPRPASAQPDISRSRDTDLPVFGNGRATADDMSDEHRRQSRARSTIHPSLFTNNQRPPDSSNNSRRGRAMSVDTTQPITMAESPAIQRNKALRQGAMDAIRQDREDDATQTPSGHRRRSSLGTRGNRLRASMESAGAISQPHKNVSESSFYKHIPPDLPGADRMRLLLSWCATRANNAPSSHLPALSHEALNALHAVQDGMLRKLSDKQVDTRTSTPQSKSATPLRKNSQDEDNRRHEINFTEQIRSMEQEDNAWNESRRFYDAYFKQAQSRLEEGPQPSAKSKGKQKATDGCIDPDWAPRHLSSREETILASARAYMRPRDDRDIQQELQDLEFNVDMLNNHLNRARTLTDVTEQLLDARFAQLAVEAHLAPAPGRSLISGGRDTDPQDLFRALARVDHERPPGKVGDAARMAMREVKQVKERGIGAVGEKRLTGIPQTPRTPRRGSTPGRDRS